LLLAPDGIIEKLHYKPFVANRFGAAMFKYLLSKPDIFINGAEILKKAGLMKAYVRDYVVNYMRSARHRQKLFNIWASIKTFDIDRDKIVLLIESEEIALYLFWGKNDKMIPFKNGQHLKQKAPKTRFHVVEGGHFIVGDKLNEVMRKI